MQPQATLTPEQLLFVLTNFQGGLELQRLLGIHESHYLNRQLATEWANHLLYTLKGFPFSSEQVKAIANVHLLWKRMTGSDSTLEIETEAHYAPISQPLEVETPDPEYREVPTNLQCSVLDYAKHLGWPETPPVIQVVSEDLNWRVAVLKQVMLEIYQQYAFPINANYGIWLGDSKSAKIKGSQSVYRLGPTHTFRGVGPFLHRNNNFTTTFMCRTLTIPAGLQLLSTEATTPFSTGYWPILVVAETVTNPEDLTRLVNTFCSRGAVLAFGSDYVLPSPGIVLGTSY